MSDLISREALLVAICEGCNGAKKKGCGNPCCDYELIETAPAVDAEPVRHGRWIEPNYVYFGAKQYICDQCKDDEYWKNRYYNYKENYCPNCGARMDGGADDV